MQDRVRAMKGSACVSKISKRKKERNREIYVFVCGVWWVCLRLCAILTQRLEQLHGRTRSPSGHGRHQTAGGVSQGG